MIKPTLNGILMVVGIVMLVSLLTLGFSDFALSQQKPGAPLEQTRYAMLSAGANRVMTMDTETGELWMVQIVDPAGDNKQGEVIWRYLGQPKRGSMKQVNNEQRKEGQ